MSGIAFYTDRCEDIHLTIEAIPIREYNEWFDWDRLAALCEIVGHRRKRGPGYRGEEIWCSTCGEHWGELYAPWESRVLITGISDALLADCGW